MTFVNRLTINICCSKHQVTMGNCNARSKSYGSTVNSLSGLESPDMFDTIVHEGPILGLSYSPDGKTIISCSDDQRIATTNVEALRSLHEGSVNYFVGHSKAVNRVVCSGDRLYSCSRDLSVKLVSLPLVSIPSENFMHSLLLQQMCF